MFFEVLELFFKRDTIGGDFARADFGFNLSLNFEINLFDGEVIVLEGGGDDGEVAVAELFDIERVFDTYNNVAIFVRDDRGALKPGRKLAGEICCSISASAFFQTSYILWVTSFV